MAELYCMKLDYLGGFQEDYHNKKNWYREFCISDFFTLEVLNSIIQNILGWDDSHLYQFRIGEKTYIFLGFENSVIIEDLDKDNYSCDISLKYLQLQINDTFYYEYDFGDNHIFRLELLSKKEVPEKKKISYLKSYKGNDLKQYPNSHLESFIEFKTSVPEEKLFRSISIPDYYKEYKNKVRFISENDYEILKQWRKSKNKREWEKAVVILDNWKYLGLESLSQKIERPVKVIDNWVRDFNAFGIKAVMNERKKRDTTKIMERTELKTKRIIEIFHQNPNVFGIIRSNWNLPSLAEVYRNQFSENMSETTVSKLINKAGYKMKKARRVLTSPDPEYREKVGILLKTLHNLKQNELLFFIDELGPLKVKKYGGRCYMKKGENITFPQIQGSKGSITMSGALCATTNQITWNYGQSKDTSSMIDLIEILYNQYHEKARLYAASWHHSNELEDWLICFNAQSAKLKYGPSVDLIPLPKSSQFLNVIESVFSGMKRAVIHHSNYRSEEEMKNAISLHFHERNKYFKENPKRAGKKIWEVDFFENIDNIKSGNYRDW